MATGDIVSVTIRADGWSADVVQSGDCTAGTYAFGLGTNNADLVNAKFLLTVTSEGYSTSGTLGTVERLVYGTAIVRKPYPDHATLDQVFADGNTTSRIALSEFIYDDDKNGGAGTSGVDVAVAVASGWCTVSEVPQSVFSGTATNSSTLNYPQAFGQWAMVPYQRFTSDPTLRFTARHRFGIARVAYTLTDAAAHTATAAATSETARQRTGSSLYATEFAAEVSLAGLDANSVLTGRAQLYPRVGDADSIFDTNAVTANDDNRMLGQCDYPFHNAATVTRYVGTGGNDTTGDGLTPATAWLTVGKALTEGSANDIELAAGTYNIIGAVTRPASLGHWRTVRPASGAAVTLQIDGSKTYNVSHLCYRGVTLQKTTANAWMLGASTDYLWYDGCTTDKNGQAAGVVSTFTYVGAGAFLTDCIVDDAAAFGMGANFSARICHWLDGCSLTASADIRPVGCVRMVACDGDRIGFYDNDGVTAPHSDPCIVEFNRMSAWNTAGTATFDVASYAAITKGASIIGNEIERLVATQAAFLLGVDFATSHVLLWNNTIAGERSILGYNSTGSAAVHHQNWSVKFNAMAQFNNKDDTFAPENSARIGSWPVGYGVGFLGNRWEGALFPGEFPGIGTVIADVAYVADKSLTGDGTGNGDYHPATGSVLLNRIPAGAAVILYDLSGRAIPNDGTGDAGALQDDLVVAPTVTTTAASSITATSATGGGTATQGTYPIVSRGVCWGLEANPTIAGGLVEWAATAGVGAFTVPFAGLVPGTKYFMRAFVIDSELTVAYGDNVTFFTGVPRLTSVQEGLDLAAAESTGNQTVYINPGNHPIDWNVGLTISFPTDASDVILKRSALAGAVLIGPAGYQAVAKQLDHGGNDES